MHAHTRTCTHKWQMDKELSLNGNAPSQMGWVLVHYAGAMGGAKQSPGAWSGARRSTDCDTNCGVGTRSPTQTPVADGLCRSRRPLPPQSKTRYSFILLSRERQLCASFLPKEIMP